MASSNSLRGFLKVSGVSSSELASPKALLFLFSLKNSIYLRVKHCSHFFFLVFFCVSGVVPIRFALEILCLILDERYVAS